MLLEKYFFIKKNNAIEVSKWIMHSSVLKINKLLPAMNPSAPYKAVDKIESSLKFSVEGELPWNNACPSCKYIFNVSEGGKKITGLKINNNEITSNENWDNFTIDTLY